MKINSGKQFGIALSWWRECYAHARTCTHISTCPYRKQVNRLYSPFQLKYGHSPRVLPYLDDSDDASRLENVEAREIVHMIEKNLADAKDLNLMLAKISQAYFVNEKRSSEIEYKVGDNVMLSTANRR